MNKIAFVLAFASMPLFAQQSQMPQMPNLEEMFFKQFDGNADGQVSKSEFMQPTEAQFDHMDRNKNGTLERAEVKAFNEEMTQRMKEMQQQMQRQMPQR